MHFCSLGTGSCRSVMANAHDFHTGPTGCWTPSFRVPLPVRAPALHCRTPVLCPLNLMLIKTPGRVLYLQGCVSQCSCM